MHTRTYAARDRADGCHLRGHVGSRSRLGGRRVSIGSAQASPSACCVERGEVRVGGRDGVNVSSLDGALAALQDDLPAGARLAAMVVGRTARCQGVEGPSKCLLLLSAARQRSLRSKLPREPILGRAARRCTLAQVMRVRAMLSRIHECALKRRVTEEVLAPVHLETKEA